MSARNSADVLCNEAATALIMKVFAVGPCFLQKLLYPVGYFVACRISRVHCVFCSFTYLRIQNNLSEKEIALQK